MEENIQEQIIKLSTLKLKPYRKFIKKLLKIEEQGLVAEKDYRKLCALFKGQIILYMDKNNAKIIAANLIGIGRCVGEGNKNSRLKKELRTPVIEIINILMQNMGFGGKLDESVIEDMEKAEDEFFPRLFRQAIKEALDNVLVNYSDYFLFSHGEYVCENDGEYLVFPFINDRPYGCKIKIGPFTNKENTNILFLLYIPQYVHKSPRLSQSQPYLIEGNITQIYIDEWEIPLTISKPLADSCLIELGQEECYNDYIPSFSFDDQDSVHFRRNYSEVAFALGQRAKYIFTHAIVPHVGKYLYEYISDLKSVRPNEYLPPYPWELDDNGDIVRKADL